MYWGSRRNGASKEQAHQAVIPFDSRIQQIYLAIVILVTVLRLMHCSSDALCVRLGRQPLPLLTATYLHHAAIDIFSVLTNSVMVYINVSAPCFMS
jgi:hypothetical protein